MTRLGLWGEGTGFNNRLDFVKLLNARGVGAMELVAIDLKRRHAACSVCLLSSARRRVWPIC